MSNTSSENQEFKYFKLDNNQAILIGNMLSMFCENAMAETKTEKQHLAECRNAFFEYLGQFNKQLSAQEIQEILEMEQENEKPAGDLIELPKKEIVNVERPKLIIVSK